MVPKAKILISEKKRKKISSINGDVYLDSTRSGASLSLEALEKATNLLDDILEQVKLNYPI